MTETYGTPPSDPWSNILAFIVCAAFLFAGAMASFVSSLDSLAKFPTS